MTFADSNDLPSEASDTAPRPGIASGSLVKTDMGKQVDVERLGNRHRVTSFDFGKSQVLAPKIKQRVEHLGQRILVIGYRELWRRGTDHDHQFVLRVSDCQEVWAADEIDAPARWIKGRDLLPGRHFLKLCSMNNSWAEVASVEVPKDERSQTLPVHELVLVDTESYAVSGVLCRTTSVPSVQVEKRLTAPLKDFPLVNFVPQPHTLSLAHADVWYRKSAALLPRCIGETLAPTARLLKMLELKQRMREIAAKSAAETTLRAEFVAKHPLPTIVDLLPDHERLASDELERAVQSAVEILIAPGEPRYSEFTGGMESHYVRIAKDVYWGFDGTQWIQTVSSRNLNLPE